MKANPLVGTWLLVSCEARGADGTVAYPLGENAKGVIIYTDEGYMSVALMNPGRTPFSGNDLFGGSIAEKVEAADTYVSYCGRYEFEGESVLHHVELSLFPNWVGQDQERRVALTRDRLTLQAPPFLIKGIEQTAVLVWQRV